ncbi:MAG: hypothetical protein GX260_05250 [Tissierellia bacterium]|nr:hypothetical protein [Bacillota bacterium]NLL23170.1 hypothetical protein [Tissierellia bacterium]
MKKTLTGLLILALLIVSVSCSQTEGSTNAQSQTQAQSKDGFYTMDEKDGLKEYLDIETGPFSDSGLRIVLDAKNTTAKFVKTDLKGNDTVEYWEFDFSKNEVERYTYVSMMGTGFYYYYDLVEDQLTRIEGDDHTDKTESSKNAGRFDGAAEKTTEEVQLINQYFVDYFGMTIEEAVHTD